MTHNDNSTAPAPKPVFRQRPRPVSAGPAPAQSTAAAYAVGYAKPPTEHRFKPGKSGNPKGRPKGARGMNTMVREMLGEKVMMTIGGKAKKVRRIEALLLKALELASKGDLRAIEKFFRLYQAAVPETVEVPIAAIVSQESDDAILQSLHEMITERIFAKGDGA